MTKRYRMTGTCRIKLPDERWIYPGQGVFEADLSAERELWFTAIGAIEAVVESPKPPVQPVRIKTSEEGG